VAHRENENKLATPKQLRIEKYLGDAVTLYRLDASIRTEGSHSRAIADVVEQQWRAAYPGSRIVRRQVGLDPIPTATWATAVHASQTPDGQRSPEQRVAVELAEREVDALVEADALLFAVPLYNFGVSQDFKTWVDLAITDPRLGSGVQPVIAGKPAVLVTVRGGGYAPGTPREGWDHATPWMRRILADLWQLELRVVEAELTLADSNPAMAHLRELAAQLRTRAHEDARAIGQALAARRAAA
jgi:FMN-dependent NADH-azoreductase